MKNEKFYGIILAKPRGCVVTGHRIIIQNLSTGCTQKSGLSWQYTLLTSASATRRPADCDRLVAWPLFLSSLTSVTLGGDASGRTAIPDVELGLAGQKGQSSDVSQQHTSFSLLLPSGLSPCGQLSRPLENRPTSQWYPTHMCHFLRLPVFILAKKGVD